MAGVNETKEALKAIGALVVVVKQLGKDGFQFDDLGALLDKYSNDEVFQKTINDGLMGLELVFDELGDLNLFEGIELLRSVSELVKAIRG